MKIEKTKLTGIARRMWGYKTLTAENVGALIQSYKLSLERNRCIAIDTSGCFARVIIRPEFYPLVNEGIRAMHSRVGFIYPALVEYYADAQWLTDAERACFLFYEPFSEEAVLIPERVMEYEIVHPWWRRRHELVEYPLFEKGGVKISRSFLVKGNQLKAYQDVASYQPRESVWEWKYFPPLHFVYEKVPTVAELEAKVPEVPES